MAAAAIFAATLSLSAATPGYVDLGKFKAAEGCQFVEVNLHTPVLKFASMFVDKDDPEAAQLIRSLKHVRVNVVGYNDSNRADTTERVMQLRRELETQGWEQMVTVKENGKAEDVAIYIKMAADDSIEGLVVTVLDGNQKQAVVVNVVGSIKPEQLAALGKNLHIDPISHLKITGGSKHVGT